MRIKVKVIPRSSLNTVEAVSDNEYRVKLTASPIDGKANTALVKALSTHLNVPKSRITIIQGHKNRTKLVEIA